MTTQSDFQHFMQHLRENAGVICFLSVLPVLAFVSAGIAQSHDKHAAKNTTVSRVETPKTNNLAP